MATHLIAPPLLVDETSAQTSELQTSNHASTPIPATNDYVSDLQDLLQMAWARTSSNLDDAATRRAELYNRQAIARLFRVGDLVMVSRPPSSISKDPKWSPRHHGPFKVIAKLSDHNYKLLNPRVQGKLRTTVIHVDHLVLLRPRPLAFQSGEEQAILQDLHDASEIPSVIPSSITSTSVSKPVFSHTSVKPPTKSRSYEVEKLLDHYIDTDGSFQYLVKWKNFSRKDNSWQMATNLNCADLLTAYWAQTGRNLALAQGQAAQVASNNLNNLPQPEFESPSTLKPSSDTVKTKRQPQRSTKLAPSANSLAPTTPESLDAAESSAPEVIAPSNDQPGRRRSPRLACLLLPS